MSSKSHRIQERSKIDLVLKKIHEYAYVETLIITVVYLILGYLINPDDICMIDGDVSYILILLAVITLFHGFENGILAIAIIAVAMRFFYPVFEYIDFLVALMMTMIYSEFHYYWNKKINKAEIDANYRGVKLDELSKAFYTLKISHDQLEKNYVIKPMSIRNSIEFIIQKNEDLNEKDRKDQNGSYYHNFLSLLEKSFNVNDAFILYKKEKSEKELFDKENTQIVYNASSKEIDMQEIFSDYLVDKAIGRKKTVYVSDKEREPSLKNNYESKYLVAMPIIQEGKVVGLLVIQKMPFVAYNRENLTSISLLLDYFAIEIRNKNLLKLSNELDMVRDEKFKFEYMRLKVLFQKYKVDSIILVLRLNNELQTRRIYEKIVRMLRSLDMVTLVEEGDYYYILLLFPLHDNATALGYLSRLINLLEEEKDKKFTHMTFTMSQIKLLNKYLREDYVA